MAGKKRLRVGLYANNRNATVERFVRCLKTWEIDFVTVWKDELKSIHPGDFDVLLLVFC